MWLQIIMPLVIGLMIFFYGLTIMRLGLDKLAGNRLEEWLLRFTRTPFIGFLTGTIATALLQSSTAITVITVGLVNARVLTYRQSIGIILGTNVGTTVTTQLIALSLSDYAIPLLIIGLIMWIIPKPTIRFTGLAIGGFSLLIISLTIMGKIAVPIANSPTFQGWLATVSENHILGVLVGTLFTAVIQSSSATTAIAMVFVEGGLIPLASAIAIILGSNLGTCLTAYLASLGGDRSGKMVAYAHIFLNLFGVLLFLPFINLLTLLTLYLANDPSIQVAHSQTIFNLLTSLLVLPFAYQFGRIVEWVMARRVSY